MSTQRDAVDRIRRTTTVWRCGGLALGLLAAAAGVALDPLGRGMILAAPVLGLGAVIGTLAGELTAGTPVPTTRRAALVVRRAGDYVPRRLASAVAVATAALAALLVATTLAGSPDDRGRAGRVLLGHHAVTGGQVHTRSLPGLLAPHETSAYSPWIGSYYSVPLAVVVAVGLLWAGFTLHRIVRRSRPGDPATTGAADDRLRSGSARVVLGACGVLVTPPLLVTSALTAVGLLSVAGHPLSWTVAAWTLVVLMPLWLVLLLGSALAVVRPFPTPRDRFEQGPA